MLKAQGRFEDLEVQLEKDESLDFSTYSYDQKLESLLQFEKDLIINNKS